MTHDKSLVLQDLLTLCVGVYWKLSIFLTIWKFEKLPAALLGAVTLTAAIFERVAA